MCSAAQKPSDLPSLFKQLLAPEASDRATAEILDLAKANPDVKPYLASHLPSVIEKSPYSSVKSWTNAARLAGELKIAEAALALTKWIGIEDLGDSGEITLSRAMRLETNPAARSLAQIGDPAVPALRDVLARGNLKERGNTVSVLGRIGSSNATAALRDHLRRETDPLLRERIRAALEE